MKSSDVVRALAPADQAGEDEPLSALMYPLRFLGMGLLIAWLCCTHVASIFPGDVFDPALRSAFDTGMRIGDIGTFLAFVLFAPRIGRLSRHKAFSWAAVALTTAGTAAVGLALIPGGVGEAVIIPASIVTAIGGAVLFCLWAEAYSQMGATRTLMYGALSCIAAAAASFLISTCLLYTSPRPYPHLSSDDVLVMDFVEGPMINDVPALRAMGLDPAKLGQRLAESFVTQIVDNGLSLIHICLRKRAWARGLATKWWWRASSCGVRRAGCSTKAMWRTWCAWDVWTSR